MYPFWSIIFLLYWRMYHKMAYLVGGIIAKYQRHSGILIVWLLPLSNIQMFVLVHDWNFGSRQIWGVQSIQTSPVFHQTTTHLDRALSI